MLVPGIEEDSINYIKDKTTAVDEHRADSMEQITPATWVTYYKQKTDNILNKGRVSTLSKRIEVTGKHVYSYGVGTSYKIQDNTQRYLTKEMELLDKPLKKPVQK